LAQLLEEVHLQNPNWSITLKRIDNEVRKIKGLPVAGYDDKTQKAYLEYPDGRREYVGK
jgi:hypothetical protein